MIHIVKKSRPRFTRFLSLVLIRLVFSEIQPFENVKIYKEMYGNPDYRLVPRPSRFEIRQSKEVSNMLVI